jgi:hypothetical protein
MIYFTDASLTGYVRYGELPRVIGVFDSPDRLLMIGTSEEVGPMWNGMALWSLTVRGTQVPGRFIIIDGKFVELGGAAE